MGEVRQLESAHGEAMSLFLKAIEVEEKCQAPSHIKSKRYCFNEVMADDSEAARRGPLSRSFDAGADARRI